MLPEIVPLDHAGPLATRVRAELDRKTKPTGSLGRLETLALQLALIQQTERPRTDRVDVLVFAADHGVVAEGVSPYPQAVTGQMVANFVAGGAAISVLARQCGATLTVVDAGIAIAPAPHPALLSRRVGAGTDNLRRVPAMRAQQAHDALDAGITLARACDADLLVLGEMGIGNTTSAAALMHAMTGLPAARCVGRGTGVDDAGVARKVAVVADAVARGGLPADPVGLLAQYGGFEVGMLAGAMLGAAAARRCFIIDGFIATAAAALAARMAPHCLDYAVFAHVSAEAPHREWLHQLGADPLLDLGLRLGEGSGAMLAVPLLRAATAILAEMATFAAAGVSERPA